LLPSALIEKPTVTVAHILSVTATEHRLKISDLKSESRRAVIVRARGDAMLRMREELEMSFADIGREFGKDHSTVMSAIERTRSRRA
jgi:chromosomal replication initiator protein